MPQGLLYTCNAICKGTIGHQNVAYLASSHENTQLVLFPWFDARLFLHPLWSSFAIDIR